MKTCSRCGESKALSEFSPNPRGREGTQAACRACRRAYINARRSQPDMTVDHIIPRRYGGSDQPRNLVPACRPCNSRKGTLPPFLVGMTKAELARWLLGRGWVREGKTHWRRPKTAATFTAAVACRISAYGEKAVMR